MFRIVLYFSLISSDLKAVMLGPITMGLGLRKASKNFKPHAHDAKADRFEDC
jgi:hypothetical protein